ncbi:MAG: hypothetical protein COZ06_02255 [Armatimonadetes bacterium CG_4_10_14_3_um_filter_66_18]|nr:DUF4038 domain-containing protein [Armatimonadota bacterium]NCP33613.1 DUF4038 domain-containing protein [Armatimonadota bacterium]NCQ25944.1 DUF4038 domain-containing protein [Armatimonadota bacterium]PIX46545.1 MAG: hypothetical protein COZ57_11500 [Armatimonadetes bacterium CG_4_8_14_3_um_filter_66_20]PIY53057.1 MAG: hypothetical protein COZ06_02255 [Armatimonadetes bacterium CG_4_10_14_3_um_filter_66_18]
MSKLAASALASAALSLALVTVWAEPSPEPSSPRDKTGAVAVHPPNPHYFQTAEGKPLLLLGDYTWGTFSDVDYDYRAMFDTLRANGLNFARVWVFWGNETGFESQRPPQNYHRANVVPYLRTGPGVATDGQPKYDLTRFNPAFFARLRAVCAAARERGLFLQLTLFDAWMIKHPHLWRLHAYHRDNNVNGVDGDPKNTDKGTDGEQGFCSLGNPPVLEAQKAFIRQTVDAVNEFDHLLFEIANENYYSAEWERHLCEFIHEYEKGKPRQHLVMPLDLPNHDYGGIKTYDFQQLHTSLLKARALNQPLLFDTDGIGNPDDATVRKAAWTAVVSGGHVSYLDDSLQPGSEHQGDERGSRRATLREQLGHLATFVHQVRFWEMEPDDTLVVGNGHHSEGFPVPAFASASAQEIVVYLPEGGEVTVDLSAVSGALTVKWMHPVEGTTTPGGTTTGGTIRTFKAPFGGDAVLYIRGNR